VCARARVLSTLAFIKSVYAQTPDTCSLQPKLLPNVQELPLSTTSAPGI
jgi:hypothetical protein